MIMKLSIGIHLTLKVLCANILWKSGSEGYIKGKSEGLILKKYTEMSREYKFLSHPFIVFERSPCFQFQIHFTFSLCLPCGRKAESYLQRQQKSQETKIKTKENKPGI